MEFKPLCKALGAEVTGVSLGRCLSEEIINRIRIEWLFHKVLLFRDQNLSVEQQKLFAMRFGKLTVSPISKPWIPEHPEVSVFSNIQIDGHDIGARPDRSFGDAWHSDYSFMNEPAGASFFYAKEVPSGGGDDTWYANSTSAYDDLSEKMKKQLDGRYWTYNYQHTMQEHAKDYSPGTHARLFGIGAQKLPDVSHPLVRLHPETGNKALFVGVPNTREVAVNGFSRQEGINLFEKLRTLATRRQYTYRHQWRPGDAILWDNRCTMHRASAFPDENGRRLCYRVTTEGGKPF